MKFGFIAKHRGTWPVRWLCAALGVSRSGFHGWLTRPRSVRAQADDMLTAKVRASFVASSRTYGARRVWHDVLADGGICGLHRIERLMRAHALRARPQRRGLPVVYKLTFDQSDGVRSSYQRTAIFIVPRHCRRPQARGLRRPASRLRGLTSTTTRERGTGSVEARPCPVFDRTNWTLSGSVRNVQSRLLHITQVTRLTYRARCASPRDFRRAENAPGPGPYTVLGESDRLSWLQRLRKL